MQTAPWLVSNVLLGIIHVLAILMSSSFAVMPKKQRQVFAAIHRKTNFLAVLI